MIDTSDNGLIDRLFIQEIINDLHRYGFTERGKADTLLKDWSRELRNKHPRLRGRTKKVFADVVGKQYY